MASPFPGDSGNGSTQPIADPVSPAEARLFGTFRIVAADGTVLTPTGRKARALLAFLLLADGAAVTRDRLTTLLWSTRGEDQARASLRQTLYEMRAPGGVGLPFLRLDRAQARVATNEVTTDLDLLRRFPGDGDGAALAALIGDRPQELLSDLDGIDPAFDDWLTVERMRRRDERRRIVLDVCERTLADGDAESASRLATCLLAIDPADEGAARLAMQASQRRGDRNGVRQIFARVEEALRGGLNVPVSAETEELYRSLASARTTTPDATAQATPQWIVDPAAAAANDAATTAVPDPTPVGPPPADQHERSPPWIAEHPPDFAARPSRHPSRRMVGAALVVLLAVIASSLWWRPPGTPARRTLFVEALQAAPGDVRATALGTGLSTELARMVLGNDATLIVADVGGPGARVPADADFIVTGETRSDAGVLYASVKLLRKGNEAILWSSAFSRPSMELDALREQMASRVADVTICALGGIDRNVAAFRAETLRLLFGACEQKHGDWNESARLLQQVVTQEPDFAHGWAMLAAATAVSALMVPSDAAASSAKAEADAQRAIALNPRDGEAYFAQALARPGLTRWMERMAILERGHALDATNGEIDSSLADALAEVGRWREATVYVQRAVDVDPFGMAKAAQRARLLGFGGDVVGAGIALRAAERRFAGQRMLVATDFRIQALVGDPVRAQGIVARGDAGFTLGADQAATWNALLKARAQPSAVNEDAAYRAFIGDQHARSQVTLRDVEMLVHLRRIDEAFEFAERLPTITGGRDDTNVLFAAGMQPLRADPRFMTLAARLGLVDLWSQSGRWPDFCGDGSVGYDCRAEAVRAKSAEARPLVASR